MNSEHSIELATKLVEEIEAIIKKLGGHPDKTFAAFAERLGQRSSWRNMSRQSANLRQLLEKESPPALGVGCALNISLNAPITNSLIRERNTLGV
jgi:hypothetical protein